MNDEQRPKRSGRRKPPNRPNRQNRSGGHNRPPQAEKPYSPPVKKEIPELNGAFKLLHEDIYQAVGEAGYVTPTPIQEQCILPLLEGKDIIGSAQTGTGKTAAFVLPMLQRLSQIPGRPQRGKPRALILAPTRELAAQIGDSTRTYSRFLKLAYTTIFGGVNQFNQVKALNRGVDVLIATPGRLLDLINQRHIDLSEVNLFILDEVDRMLDMGFIPDIQEILKTIPSERQTMFFSATMTPKMIALAKTMVKNDPVEVSIEPEVLAVESIKQRMLFVDKKNKDKLLMKIMGDPSTGKTIIFTQMKHVANKVTEQLQATGVRVTAIHGNKTQAARTKALEGFKNNRFSVLVATDVAARGLDVYDITHVINYDLPVESETYIHRIGRTARAGAEGDAISFCTAEDRAYLRFIEKMLDQEIEIDFEHGYHSEKAQYSKLPPPPRGGGGGGGRRGGGGGGRRNSSGNDRGGSRSGQRSSFGNSSGGSSRGGQGGGLRPKRRSNKPANGR